MSGYHAGDTVKVNMKDGRAEYWRVHGIFPNRVEETDPDVLFFVEQFPGVVNGTFSFIQYLPDSDQWEAVVTMKCRRITRSTAEAVDKALIERYGSNWRLWVHSHTATKDLHVIYWS